MTVLRYKDYQGSVSFDEGRLLIRVLHIDDFLTTECDSASGVQAEFEALIDDYLETCQELGKQPSKPFKGSFNIRIPPELHRKAAMFAAEHGETLNAWVTGAIERRIRDDDVEMLAASSQWVRKMLATRTRPSADWSALATVRHISSEFRRVDEATLSVTREAIVQGIRRTRLHG
jgi:predicted HicB family RNase H-like nuclease